MADSREAADAPCKAAHACTSPKRRSTAGEGAKVAPRPTGAVSRGDASADGRGTGTCSEAALRPGFGAGSDAREFRASRMPLGCERREAFTVRVRVLSSRSMAAPRLAAATATGAGASGEAVASVSAAVAGSPRSDCGATGGLGSWRPNDSPDGLSLVGCEGCSRSDLCASTRRR